MNVLVTMRVPETSQAQPWVAFWGLGVLEWFRVSPRPFKASAPSGADGGLVVTWLRLGIEGLNEIYQKLVPFVRV